MATKKMTVTSKHDELMQAINSINTKVKVDNALLNDCLREIAANSQRMARRSLVAGILSAVNIGVVISLIVLYVSAVLR